MLSTDFDQLRLSAQGADKPSSSTAVFLVLHYRDHSIPAQMQAATQTAHRAEKNRFAISTKLTMSALLTLAQSLKFRGDRMVPCRDGDSPPRQLGIVISGQGFGNFYHRPILRPVTWPVEVKLTNGILTRLTSKRHMRLAHV